MLKAWTGGTVVRSWLLDLLVNALEEDPGLDEISGFIDDSGEGRWTVKEAINHAVPLPVISAALFARFASRQDDSPAMRAVAALRNQFGGHAVHAAGPRRRRRRPQLRDRCSSVFVRQLQVTDFRSWQQAELALEPGANVLVGSNGQGKTNLVEAIGYLATLGSHRVATDAPLVRHGAQRAVVRAAVVNDGRELLVDLEITPGRANRARVNRAPVPRPRDVLGILRTVLFAPEDLALVKGDPGERRRFADELLVARSPRFAGVRADYDRVLKQRGALLKTAGAARRAGGSGDIWTLDVWDGHLARHGAELLAGRLDLVADLAPHVAAAYAGVAPESVPVQVRYRCSLGDSLRVEYGVPGGERADRETWRPCCWSSWPGCGSTRSTGVSVSSVRTATIWN